MTKCTKCGGELDVEQILEQYDEGEGMAVDRHVTTYQGYCTECNAWHHWTTIFVYDHDKDVKLIDEDGDDDFFDYGDDFE